MGKTAIHPALAQLLEMLEEAFRRRSWHGTNLRGSIRGLSAGRASAFAGRAQHSIADIVVHCAYWKYTVRRRLRGEPRGSFPLTGSNWFPLESPLTERAWRGYVRLLEEQHRLLLAAVEEMTPQQLKVAARGGTVSPLMLVRGVAMHDVYHAGQIQLIKNQARAG